VLKRRLLPLLDLGQVIASDKPENLADWKRVALQAAQDSGS